ncbi:hypothetical protein KEM56_007649, partial [Ascosphaera pollenicola]
VPFYPADWDPKAVCPVCYKDRLDDGVETVAFPLYASKIGELDPRLPKGLFEPPKIWEDLKDSYVFDIIKFQYESLLRFAAGKVREPEDNESKQSLCTERSFEIDGQCYDEDAPTVSSPAPSSGLEEDEEPLNNTAQYISPVSIASHSSWNDSSYPSGHDGESSINGEHGLEGWKPYSRPKTRIFSRTSFPISKAPQRPHITPTDLSHKEIGSSRFPLSIASLSKLRDGVLKAPTPSTTIFKKPSLPYHRRPEALLGPEPKKQKGGSWFPDSPVSRNSSTPRSPLPFSMPKIRTNTQYNGQISLLTTEGTFSNPAIDRGQGSGPAPNTRRTEKAPASSSPYRESFRWLKRKFSEREADAEANACSAHPRSYDDGVPAFIGDSRITGNDPVRNGSFTSLASGSRDNGSVPKLMLTMRR